MQEVKTLIKSTFKDVPLNDSNTLLFRIYNFQDTHQPKCSKGEKENNECI